ncbi:CAAX prenyl protease-like protein [Hydrogenispora ethanolica]|uniref:CAAX prenyl protease-like protein n=1 Tax=Hydrogenispora ethanolica TaxID=1082276 RepID=A0A4V6NGT7_HYDET|nr:CPBP family intramembrane glutamic endopeptidase [Hydrogenispora ethanolica]TCL63357.1 CAAX prenyl protease-like protein [Hydrogenispora ethanolica]
MKEEHISTITQKQPADKNWSHRFVIVVGLSIAYLPGYIHKILNLFGTRFGPEGPPSVILWNWLSVLVLTLYIIVIERRGLASIRLARPTKKDLEWACIFWGIGMSWNWIMNMIAPQPHNEGLDTLINLPLPVIIALIITTAVTEEILFRGYSIERLRELTGKLWIAVSLSFMVFVFPHIQFFETQWLLYHGIGTVFIYILYVWRRNLWACILTHFLSNAPLLILAIGLD